MSYWDKPGSARPNVAQVIQLSSAAAVASNAFASQTRSIRIISPIAAWVAIGPSGTAATVQSAGSFFIAANTATGDYFTVNPGEVVSCISLSSASTGTVSVLEVI